MVIVWLFTLIIKSSGSITTRHLLEYWSLLRCFFSFKNASIVKAKTTTRPFLLRIELCRTRRSLSSFVSKNDKNAAASTSSKDMSSKNIASWLSVKALRLSRWFTICSFQSFSDDKALTYWVFPQPALPTMIKVGWNPLRSQFLSLSSDWKSDTLNGVGDEVEYFKHSKRGGRRSGIL